MTVTEQPHYDPTEPQTPPAAYAAVRIHSDQTPGCYGYGETREQCRDAAAEQCQIRYSRDGRRLYYSLTIIPLDADQASEVAEMLDADWMF